MPGGSILFVRKWTAGSSPAMTPSSVATDPLSPTNGLTKGRGRCTQVRMRTEQALPIRLEDYRPPDWLVDTVELDVLLGPTATRVIATLALKPNPKAAAPAPLVLDGDGLALK